jgi:hypothetical protein
MTNNSAILLNVLRFHDGFGIDLNYNVTRALVIGLLILGAVTPAAGQNLGYVLNKSDGTVTIFGTVTNPTSGALIESNLQTVTVCEQPTASGAMPVAGLEQTVYVTCADNSLWMVDASNIGLGQAPIAENINVGNKFQLNSPTGIVVTFSFGEPGCAVSKGAFVANSGNNTVSVIDLGSQVLLNGCSIVNPIQLGTPSTGTSSYPAQIGANAYNVIVTTNNPTPQAWEIGILPRGSIINSAPFMVATEMGLGIQSALSPIYICGTGVGGLIPNVPYLFVTYASPQPPQQMIYFSGGTTFSANLGSAPPTGCAGVGYVNGEITSTSYVGAVDNSGELWTAGFSLDGEGVARGATSTSIQLAASSSAPNGLALAGGYVYVTDGTSKLRLASTASLSSGVLIPDGFSSVSVGNGSSSLFFFYPDPYDAPTCWFNNLLPVISALASQNSVSGVCTSNPLYNPSSQTSAVKQSETESRTADAAVTTIKADTTSSCTLNCPNNVTTSLNMGSVNGMQATCVGQGSSGSTCTSQNPQQGFNILSASGSFPASGVTPIIVGGTATSTTTAGSAQQQVQVGANCTTNIPTASVAVGQMVNATLNCTTPLSDKGGVSATVNWGDGTTPTKCSGTTSCGTVNDGSVSESVVLSFSHAYTSPNSPAQASYSVTVPLPSGLNDDAEGVPGALTNPQPVAITVVPISVSLSPLSATVLGEHSQSFAANVQYDVTNSGVSWALSGAGCTGAACGTLTQVTTTSVTYNAPSIVPTPPTVTLTAKSLSSNQATVSSPVMITLTPLPAPSCTLNAPTAAQVNVSLTVTVACTAPANDMLSGTVNWGDGTTASTATGTASGSGAATLTFTHTYATASKPTDSVSATVTDTTTALAGTVNPASVAITVSTTPPPSCSLSATPTKIQVGQSVAATLTCTAPANDMLSGTVNWGDGTTASTTTGTAGGSGSATLSLTHTYATVSSPTDSLTATVTDTTSKLPGNVSPASVTITVFATPAVTTPQSSVSGTPGQAVNVSASFAGGAAEAGVVFSTITCTVTPTAPCTPSSSTLTLDANGNGTLTFTVTPPATAMSVRVPGDRMPRAPLWAFMMLFSGMGLVYLAVSISAGQRRRWTWSLALLLLMIPTLLAMEACGGGSSSTSTPSGSSVTYTASVQAQSTATATLPAIKASGGFTVTVQYP